MGGWGWRGTERGEWELKPEHLTCWAVSSEILCGQENGNVVKIQMLPVNSDTLKIGQY